MLTLSCASSRQPWSAYAVHLTTLSPPAIVGDMLLIWFCHQATAPWGAVWHAHAMHALFLWMFTSKWIKLLGHFIRYPVDVLLLPVSILFGYFHGIIKVYAALTLNVVSVVSSSSLLLIGGWRVRSGRRIGKLAQFGGCLSATPITLISAPTTL